MNVYRNLDVNATGALVKTGQATLRGWFLYNGAASPRFIKLYNKATIATQADTPVLSIALPATCAANFAMGESVGLDFFPLGLAIRAVTGIADNDVGAPTANDVVVNLFYQ